jgi:hypothetical protein
MPKPSDVEIPTARGQEQRVCKLDERETPHVAQVDKVREDAEGRWQKGEPIDDAEEQLQGHDGVD